jgi:hypothetical protein
MTDTTETPEILRQAPAGRVVLWTGEVATLAGVTPMTVTRWARSGKVEASTTSGGNRRFWPPAVVKLLNELGREVPPWLAGVAAALAGTRPLEIAEALDAALEDLPGLVSDLGITEAWLAEDCEAEAAADMASVVRRARLVVEALADREAEGAAR